MERNELRINNWVIDEAGRNCKIVEGQTIDDADRYRPIRLEPLVLEKCGFQMEDNCASKVIDAGNHLALGIYPDGSTKIYTSNEDESTTVDLPNNIIFLHQLQNLCYFLCGEELAVEL